MKRLLISAALVALGASTQASAAFVASPITIDRDGAGGTSAIKVTSLNWLAGNTLTVGALAQAGEVVSSLGTTRTLDTYYQAALNTFVFNSSGGSTQYLNTTGSEWTVVAKIKMTGKHAFVAPWLEYGVGAHQIAAKKGGWMAFGGVFAKSVQHPGIQPRPFMRPALDSRAQAAVVAAAEYTKKRLATKHGLDTKDVEIEAQ